MTLYHVTSKDRLEQILKEGLMPRYGYLSQIMEEDDCAVYLFKDLDHLEEDFDGWLKMAYKEDNRTLLKVTLPDDFGDLWERFGWEMVCYKPIPPKYLESIPFPWDGKVEE